MMDDSFSDKEIIPQKEEEKITQEVKNSYSFEKNSKAFSLLCTFCPSCYLVLGLCLLSKN